MNKGNINIELINKDIAFIDYYGNEEESKLIDLYARFEDLEKSYSSDNSSLFLQSISNYQSDIKKIKDKRQKYILILKKAIDIYVKTSKKVADSFDKIKSETND